MPRFATSEICIFKPERLSGARGRAPTLPQLRLLLPRPRGEVLLRLRHQATLAPPRHTTPVRQCILSLRTPPPLEPPLFLSPDSPPSVAPKAIALRTPEQLAPMCQVGRSRAVSVVCFNVLSLTGKPEFQFPERTVVRPTANSPQSGDSVPSTMSTYQHPCRCKQIHTSSLAIE